LHKDTWLKRPARITRLAAIKIKGRKFGCSTAAESHHHVAAGVRHNGGIEVMQSRSAINALLQEISRRRLDLEPLNCRTIHTFAPIVLICQSSPYRSVTKNRI
jgi:hypothetical protein